MSGDGNGFNPIDIDVTNDFEFKNGMVKYMQMLVDRTDCLPGIKKKVERHEQVINSVKYFGPPLLVLLHAALKSFFHKLGWWE
jgi:hypothetical protein